MFDSVYNGKTVLITGHTGFKGSWLAAWLEKLGARIIGISKDIPTNPSHFECLSIKERISHHIVDITDIDSVRNIFNASKPDFVFHLAAQAIVSESHFDPIKTVSSNVLGTSILLQVLREQEHKIAAVIITSDKCYENEEWIWGYRENDKMGGKDIYSASKGAAELIFHAFFKSIIKAKTNIKVATARAGNVIGGGDWAKDRVVVDAFTNWNKRCPVEIRSPQSTRPWQHVLEPLSGYLMLGQELYLQGRTNGESYNFGPDSHQSVTVIRLINDLFQVWGEKSFEPVTFIAENNPVVMEAQLLRLNCEKAQNHLGWEPTLDYEDCVNFVGSWYKAYYSKSESPSEISQRQIEEYSKIARIGTKKWTNS